MMLPSDLGHYIASRRRLLNLSQQELGDKVGKDQRFVSNLENNPSRVALGTVMAVLHALDAQLFVHNRPSSSDRAVQSDSAKRTDKSASEYKGAAPAKRGDAAKDNRLLTRVNPSLKLAISPRKPAIVTVRKTDKTK